MQALRCALSVGPGAGPIWSSFAAVDEHVDMTARVRIRPFANRDAASSVVIPRVLLSA